MKPGRMTLFLLIVPLSVMLAAGAAHAEARSIYVGDIVEIRVMPAQQMTKDELLEAFAMFEYVNVAEDAGGYILTLRSFEPGEKQVTLGDKELVIVVRSMLNDVERDGVFAGDPALLAPRFRLEWQYALYVLAAAFLVSGGAMLRKMWPRRSVPSVSPDEQFRSRINELPEHDERYAAKLTLIFKDYMEAAFACRIRGKTSSELLEDIGGLPEVREHVNELAAWLASCDRMKYSGMIGSPADNRQLRDRLMEWVGKLDGKPNEAKGIGA